jgi:hypothetical protein
MQRFDRRWIWVGLFGLTILLRVFLSPEQIESWYSRGFFLGVRYIQDWLTYFVPVPFIYLLLGGIMLWLLVKTYRWWNWEEKRWKKGWSAGFTLLSTLSVIGFFFMVLWGYNYGRVPLEKQIGIQPEPVEIEILGEMLKKETAALATARLRIQSDTTALTEMQMPVGLEEQLRELMKTQLEELGYPANCSVRGRFLRPKGVLLRFSSAGVYLPWTGEGHIDAGLHPVEHPFVMAHELAHGFGITDEGSCNFLAYLACRRSQNPFIAYSGRLGYWRYLASNYRRAMPEEYRPFFRGLDGGIREDLRAIYSYLDRYPDILPQLRYVAYDTYLKAQGIKEGMKNYNRVIMLAKAWEAQEENQ